MKTAWQRIALSMIFAGLVCVSAGADDPKPAADADIPLTKNAGDVAVSLRWSVGRNEVIHELEIHNDGTIMDVAESARTGKKEAKRLTKIAVKDLQDLLRFAVNANKFFELDQTKIDQLVEKGCVERYTLRISVRGRKGEFHYGTPTRTKENKEPLKRLFEIGDRVRSLAGQEKGK